MSLDPFMPLDTNVAHVNNEEENAFSDSLLTFAAVMTFIIMIVGIFGNSLTVIALLRCPKVRNVAAAFIISLGIADLLFCALVLPFNGLRFLQGTWMHGDVLCKLIPFIQYGNVGVSLLCIAMITINRYVMIAHHNAYAQIYKRHWIALMVIFCWSFSYGMQLPTLLGAWGTFDYDPKLGTCSILPDAHGNSSKTPLFIIAFVIPCLIIVACYAKIFWVVHQSETRLKRHACKQNSIPNNLRPTATALSSSAGGISSGGGGGGSGGGEVNAAASAMNVGDYISSTGSSFSTTTAAEMKRREASGVGAGAAAGAGTGTCIVVPTRVKDQREVRAKRNEWRITKMVLAIFLSFVVCYLPITIVKIADKDVAHPGWHIFSYIMLYLSACVNPIIYVIMNKQYRKAYKTVIMCDPSCLLSFGKHDAGVGGAARGSSIPEKWKDTGLSNNNHSRTMVSQMSDPQNTTTNSGTPSRPVSLEMTVSTPTITTTPPPPPKMITMPVNVKSQNNNNSNYNSHSNTNGSDYPPSSNNNNNNNYNHKAHNNNLNTHRIAIVGEDIILEEEEEPAIVVPSQPPVLPPPPPLPLTPPPPSPPLAPMAAMRAEPTERIYANVDAALVPKRSPYYGQNINDTPDNGAANHTITNNNKLNTKTKI